MKLLFISRRGESLGLAMRCQSEGYPTSLFLEEESTIGDGIVERTIFSSHLLNQRGECIASNIKRLLSETLPDLVVFDGEGMGKVADYIKELNLPVFGSSYWSDTVQSNMKYGREMMKRVGIKKWEGEEGVKVECGFWWNGIQLSSPYIVWNENRFMTGSLGPLISSSSNIISCSHLHSALTVEGVGKIVPLLKKSKFRGLLSMNCVVNKSNLYAISFTTSLLFLPSLLELYKGSVTDLILSVASGGKAEGEFTTDYALSLLLSIPPYPSPIQEYNRVKIGGINSSNIKHLYLLDVEKSGDEYESASSSGKLMWVSARGRDVGEAKKRVMKTISNLDIEDIQYRTDSTTRFSSEEDKLQKYGYLI